MPFPTYSVDGVALDSPGWHLAPGTQLRPLPAVRSVEVRLPGRAGDVPVLGLDHEATSLGLTLNVTDRDHQGRRGGFPGLEGNLEALTGLFGTRHRLLDLRYHVDARTTRRADAEVISSAEPEVDVASARARLTVLVRIPGVYWRGTDLSTWQARLLTDPPEEGTVVSWLSGSTAPITDAQVEIHGRVDRPTVVDVATGGGFTWPGALSPNQGLAVDCAAMRAHRFPLDSPGEREDVTGLVSGIGPGSASRWLHLTPALVRGNPHQRHVRVRADAVSAGEATEIRISARRSFL
ncbi:hypothetical protein [Nocardiopsis ganjiahuensis]|uniref:hypothetical protein n=1 Tax=Nocardiopsis ganjiahuensis TaxID=239984 RepID=UPI0004755D15|nr:hypothetical protein [Nocardiopsis ganjiahuensis]